MEKFKEYQDLLKDLNYETLTDKHYKLAMKGVTSIIDNKIDDKVECMDLVMKAQESVDKYAKGAESFFPIQSDFFLTCAAFETVILNLKKEFDTYVNTIMEENEERANKIK